MDKTRTIEYKRNYYRQNRDKIRQTQRQYYLINKDVIQKKILEWRKNNPNKVRIYRMKSCALWRKRNWKKCLDYQKEYRLRSSTKQKRKLEGERQRHSMWYENYKQIRPTIERSRYWKDINKSRFIGRKKSLGRKYGDLAKAKRVLIEMQTTLKSIKKGGDNVRSNSNQTRTVRSYTNRSASARTTIARSA